MIMTLRAFHRTKEKMIDYIVAVNLVTKEIIYDEDDRIDLRASFDRVVIMQATGLTDSNGRMIFEGDIVHLTSEDGVDYHAQIVFMDGGFCAIDGDADDYGVRRYNLSDHDLKIEVTGNVHENGCKWKLNA